MTKRREILAILQRLANEEGLELELKEGGNHTIVLIGGRKVTVVARHNEIDNQLAKRIYDQAGLALGRQKGWWKR